MPRIFFVSALCACIPLSAIGDNEVSERSVGTVEKTRVDGAKTYPIRFARPYRKGQLFSYASLGATRERTTVRWAGSIVEDGLVEFQCELAAVAHVLEIDDKGLPVEMSFRVFRFYKRHLSESEEMLKKDTIISAKRLEDGWFYAVDDEAVVDENMTKALAVVLQPPLNNDDAFFGSERDRRIGATWLADNEAIGEQFKGNGLEVDPDKLAVIVSLDGLAAAAGHQCTRLSVEMRATDAGFELPEGFKRMRGELEVKLSGSFPLNLERPRSEESSEFTLSTYAVGQVDGKSLEATTEIKRTFRARLVQFGDR